ncbi:MAG TPA: nucleotide exchange factor GrpE [Cyclobacteriaceae bacterium]|nr:nucleotide exchange factor GrpE [Cyclobacteriaceae bacterium]
MEKNVQQEQETVKNEEQREDLAPSEKAEKEGQDTPEQSEEQKIDPFKKLQDDLSEAKDKYVRLYAEFENHRRRTAKEKLEMIQSANERLIVELLPVIDDFERAEKANASEGKEVEGYMLIQSKLKKILEQSGVKPMDTPVETEFNPDLHEAVTQIPAPEEKLKGKIVDTIEKGYLINDKVIRYAKVVIGN